MTTHTVSRVVADSESRLAANPKAFAEVLSSDEIRRLTEIGFVAAGRGDVARAQRIFAPLLMLRPKRAFPRIGLAMAWLNFRRPQEAARVLAEGVADVEDCPEEKALLCAYLGLALQFGGERAKSEQALAAAIAITGSEGARLASHIAHAASALVQPARSTDTTVA